MFIKTNKSSSRSAHTDLQWVCAPHAIHVSRQQDCPSSHQATGKGASSPYRCSIPHAHRKAMLCRVYVPRVCSQDASRKQDQQDRESDKEIHFLRGTCLCEYGSWAFPRPQVSKETQECSSSPAMKPQNQESWPCAFPSDIQQVPDPGGAKVPVQCEFKGRGTLTSQLRTSQAGGLLSYSAFLFSGGEHSRSVPSTPGRARRFTPPTDSDVSLGYEHPDKCITTKFWPNV